eukprot:3860343-Amphidinium_carterae.1
MSTLECRRVSFVKLSNLLVKALQLEAACRQFRKHADRVSSCWYISLCGWGFRERQETKLKDIFDGAMTAQPTSKSWLVLRGIQASSLGDLALGRTGSLPQPEQQYVTFVFEGN